MKKSILIPSLLLFLLLIAGGIYFVNREIKEQTVENEQDLSPEIEKETDPTLSGELSGLLDTAAIGIDSVKYPLSDDGFFEINWPLLAKVDFEERYNEDLEDYIYYPIFHKEIKAFDQQPVRIKGYVIPIEETGSEDVLILSAFPFSNCFFCGNAGPESVIDVQLKKNQKKRFRQDEQLFFRGTLVLNDTDVYYLNYILKDAEVVKGN
jgi:hypothetical protein